MPRRTALLAALLLAGAVPAGAQQPAPAPAAPGAASDVGRIIESLDPRTRGIIVPPSQGTQDGGTAARTQDGLPSVSITVNFPTNSARLTAAAEAALAPLGEALASPVLGGYRFRVEGHTDTVGSAASNQRLSERRAAAVRDHLVRRFGIAPGRLQAVGLGETQPAVPTPDGRSEPRNRRVQVVNLGR